MSLGEEMVTGVLFILEELSQNYYVNNIFK